MYYVLNHVHFRRKNTILGIDVFKTYVGHFHGNQFESLLLKPLDNITDKATMHSIGLEHNKSSFVISRHFQFQTLFLSNSRISNELLNRRFLRFLTRCQVRKGQADKNVAKA